MLVDIARQRQTNLVAIHLDNMIQRAYRVPVSLGKAVASLIAGAIGPRKFECGIAGCGVDWRPIQFVNLNDIGARNTDAQLPELFRHGQRRILLRPGVDILYNSLLSR